MDNRKLVTELQNDLDSALLALGRLTSTISEAVRQLQSASDSAKSKRTLPRAIAIDFGGCLCANAYPEIGAPHWNIIAAAAVEQRHGAGIILWTCREGKLLQDALEACERWGLHFDAVNESLPAWKDFYGNDTRKVGADEYWDDKAYHVENGSFLAGRWA